MHRVLLRVLAWLGAVLVLLCATRLHAKGVDPQKLALPKGPASIEGLGRNFATSLASGTSSYGVDIAVPPAVGGFSPKLSLEYDSGGGMSEIGMGWRLDGVPSIRRRVDQGLPRFNDTDSFELSGIGMPCDLVEAAPGTFRPEYETGSFPSVQRSADGSTWQARDKSGITYNFGGSGYTEAEGGNVAAYLLRQSVDLHGHTIGYEWDTTSGHALLTRVSWNDFGATTRIEVVFTYEARPDVVVRFSSGIKQSIDRRLTTIDVTYGGSLVRRYTLAYGAGIHPQLVSVTMVGTDGSTAAPKLSLGYTEPSFTAAGQVVTMTTPPGRSPTDGDVTIADLNGDGLPDLLVTQAGQYRTYVNHDGVAWQAPQDWATTDSPSLALSTTGVELADLDGDGAIDLVAKSGATDFRYFPGKDATHFSAPVAITTVPNFTFEDPDVRLGDMDGDRRTDVVITTSAGLAIGYNLGGRDWTVPATVGVVDPTQPLRFSDGFTQLCDVNGDRVQDLCYLHSGSLVYWLGRGRGKFEAAATATGVPTWDPSSPWKLIDLNGDGWADLVHVGVSQVDYELATAVGQFGALQTIANTPQKLSTTAVEFHDMNGSGTTDIVWIDVSGSADQAWKYLELFPEGRAGLLSSIDNGLGKATTITYEPAAKSAARSRTAQEPWKTRMNVGMPVVRRIEIDSSLAALLGDPVMATEYDYRDGTWDPKERTFGAFGGGTERAIGDTNTPTLITESTFDTGLLHRVLRGSLLTSEQRDEQGYVFSRTTNAYTTVTLATVARGQTVEYAYRSSERVEHVEGTDPSLARVTLTEWQQDEFGNAIKESKWGEVVGADKLAGNDEAITVRTFANNTEDWILGRLASEEVEDAAGTVFASKRFYYDGAPFQGLGLGEVARGDVRRVESWIEGSRWANDAAFDHDEHGNVTVVIDARGGRSEYDYDPESRAFVVAERRFVDDQSHLDWAGEYDKRFGVVTSLTDANGAKTLLGYDALGRATAITGPGDTPDKPTIKYTYTLGAPLSNVRTEQRETSGQDGTIVSLSYVDGVGRQRGKVTEAAEAGHWTLSDFGRVDARGNKSFVTFATDETTDVLPALDSREGTLTGYDALGRVVGTRHVDGSSTKTVYGALERAEWDENDNDPNSVHAATPTTYLSDGLGRLRQVIELEGTRQITAGSYSYDALGNVTEIVDAIGSVRTYDYDGRSRRVGIHDPNAGDWTLLYTDGNDLASRIDPTGSVVRWTYDELGRPLEEWHQAAGAATESLAARYHYDAASPEHAEYKHTKGQVGWVEDAAGAMFLGYSARGLVTEKTRRWKDGGEHTSWNDYDAADRPIRRGYPDKTHLVLKYDAGGQLLALGPIVPELRWTAEGALSSQKLGNGVVDTRGYDRRRRLEAMTAKDASGTALRDIRLGLDAASRITHVEDLRPSVPAAESQTATYTFDDRYRLVTADDAVASTTWVLDDVAKILSVTSGHPAAWLNVTNTYGESGAGPGQLTHHGDEALTYDAAGRVAKDGERVFEWDAKGRLAKVTRGEVVEEYTYAFDDSRVVKKTTRAGVASTVRYPERDAEEREGKIVRYAFVGDDRIARLDALAGDTAPAAAAPSSTAAGEGTAAGSLARNLAAGRSSLYWLAVAMSGFLVSLLVAFRRRRDFGLLPRLAAWATCAAAVSFLILPSCSCEDDKHAVSKDPRNDSKEITEVPASAQFYLGDWQDSPTALANATGAVVSRTAYHPYGSVRNTVGGKVDPWSFVGNEKDEGAGLGDFHARPYRAELGMFLGPDPVGTFEAEKTLEKPAGAFTYVYGEGDPVDVVDRDGRCGTPYAAPGTGCTRSIGPQLPEAAQKEVDRNLLKGWLVAAEVTSYVTGAGDAAAAARALSAAIRARAVAAVARGVWAKVAGMTARSGGRQIAKAAAREVGAGAKALRGADTWGSPKTLARHFRDHGAEFAAKNADDYATQASGFLQRSQAQRLPTKIDTEGVIRVYDPKTNTFGAFNPNRTTRTFFKPSRGEAYWADQPGVSP